MRADLILDWFRERLRTACHNPAEKGEAIIAWLAQRVPGVMPHVSVRYALSDW